MYGLHLYADKKAFNLSGVYEFDEVRLKCEDLSNGAINNVQTGYLPVDSRCGAPISVAK